MNCIVQSRLELHSYLEVCSMTCWFVLICRFQILASWEGSLLDGKNLEVKSTLSSTRADSRRFRPWCGTSAQRTHIATTLHPNTVRSIWRMSLTLWSSCSLGFYLRRSSNPSSRSSASRVSLEWAWLKLEEVWSILVLARSYLSYYFCQAPAQPSSQH